MLLVPCLRLPGRSSERRLPDIDVEEVRSGAGGGMVMVVLKEANYVRPHHTVFAVIRGRARARREGVCKQPSCICIKVPLGIPRGGFQANGVIM